MYTFNGMLLWYVSVCIGKAEGKRKIEGQGRRQYGSALAGHVTTLFAAMIAVCKKRCILQTMTGQVKSAWSPCYHEGNLIKCELSFYALALRN